METPYQESVTTLGQNLILFKDSVKTCNIPKMLEHSSLFVETLMHSNNIYDNLPTDLKHKEEIAFNRSRAFVHSFLNAKSTVEGVCDCRLKD